MSIFSNFNFCDLKQYPIVQVGSIAVTSYLGIKISQIFQKEVNPYLNYFGKITSIVAAVGILYFSGLFSEKFFVDRISFNVLTLGPLDCSISLEDLRIFLSRIFNS